MVKADREKVLELLHNAINDICLKCGKYTYEHLGACKDCGWLEVKESDLWQIKK